MKPWLKNIHLVFSIGGGFAGAVTVFIPISQQGYSPGLGVIVFIALVFYIYGIFAGLRFAADTDDRVHLKVFYCLQIPVILSSLFSYQLVAGAHLTLGISGFALNAKFSLGSVWFLSCFIGQSFAVGINVVALALLLSLGREKSPQEIGDAEPLDSEALEEGAACLPKALQSPGAKQDSNIIPDKEKLRATS